MPTAQQIYDKAQDLAKVDASTYGIPAFEEARVIDWINWIRDDYFTRTELLRKTTIYDTGSATAVASAYTAGGSTLTLDSVSGFNGAFVIDSGTSKEIGEHTGTSGSDLTNVANLNLDHAVDAAVMPLIKLPAHVNIHQVTVGGTDVEPLTYDIDGDVFLNISEQNAKVTVRYSYLPTAITDLSDDVTISSPYEYFLIYGLLKIWKEVEESTADTSLEEMRMAGIVQQAVSKKLQAKKLNITTFNRYRS